MCATNTTISSTGQCSYLRGNIFGAPESAFAFLAKAGGLATADEPSSSLPGPCEFRLLLGEVLLAGPGACAAVEEDAAGCDEPAGITPCSMPGSMGFGPGVGGGSVGVLFSGGTT